MPITFPADSQNRTVYHEVFDDFNLPASTTASEVMAWTSLDDGATGTNAFQDVEGGWYNLVTAAANNDYHGIRSVNKTFKFAASKPVWLEAQFKLSEANTNESAWWFGFTDTTTTGGFGTGTSGPLSSYSGALIYKKSAQMLVGGQTSNTTTQNTISTGLGTAITNTTHKVALYFDGSGSSTGTSYVTFHFWDGTTWSASPAVPISMTSLPVMYLVAGVKAGATGGAETLQVDYIRAMQTR